LTKNSSCATWSAQAHVRQRRFRLRAGRVQHEHVDGAEAAGHRRNEIGNASLVGDIGHENVCYSAVVSDGGDDLERLRLTLEAVDGHGQAIAGETPGDGTAEPARATCHERDALPVGTHTRDHPSITLREHAHVVD
jgi:hypothetical protein